MKYVRVPFAIHKPTQEYVDVDEVQSGKQCNCFCPSCKSDLVAKHGDKKIHHFAHLKSEVEIECDYSIYFSIRMMYLSMFKKGLSDSRMFIPEYVLRRSTLTRYNQTAIVFKCLIRAGGVDIIKTRAHCEINNIRIDALVQLADSKGFGIMFHYDEHPLTELSKFEGLKFPILAIDISPLKSALLDKTSNISNTQIMRDYLSDSSIMAKWAYVPVNVDLADELREEVARLEKDLESTLPHAPSIDLPKRNIPKNAVSTFKYTNCGKEWNAKHGYLCPKCGGRGKLL
ncbi:competence protein CoiA family protein [Photobacterium leiognathi]|uniref:competence protein CoiA family protein n=1 Tax=Photobacterium leiognathi TaxID=553611 RepID=UPI00273A21FF|nr:competence protein CoiA family protein [Photobacterium leiognathi]